MKRLLFIMLGVAAMINISGCHSDNYLENIRSGLEDVPNFDYNHYSYVVIIPNAGCTGCISEAEDFFFNNKDESIFFIFTKIFSMKDFRLKVGNRIGNRKNAYVDDENVFMCEDESISLYPIVVDVRDMEHLSWEYLNPGEDMSAMFD